MEKGGKVGGIISVMVMLCYLVFDLMRCDAMLAGCMYVCMCVCVDEMTIEQN